MSRVDGESVDNLQDLGPIDSVEAPRTSWQIIGHIEGERALERKRGGLQRVSFLDTTECSSSHK